MLGEIALLSNFVLVRKAEQVFCLREIGRRIFTMNEEVKQKFLQVLDEEAEKVAVEANDVIAELSTKHHYLSGRLSFPWLERIVEDIDSDEIAGFYWEARDRYFDTPIESREIPFWLELKWFEALKEKLEARKLFLVDNAWIGWSC